MNMKKTKTRRISRIVLSMMLALALAISLIPAAMPAVSLAADGDAGSGSSSSGGSGVVDPQAGEDEFAYSVEFDPATKNTTQLYYNVYYFPEDCAEGDQVTITDNATGEKTVFTYKINAFYDKDWKTMVEHGYAMAHLWAGDYTLDQLTDDNGESFDYLYFLYKVNENGKPVDADGNVLDNKRAPNVLILGMSDVYTIHSITDCIKREISGIHYFAFVDKPGTVCLVMTDPDKVKGALKLPAKVKMGSNTYPLTEIQADAFKDCKKLTSVKIPRTVTEIATNAFLDTGLKKIKIPSSVEEIGEAALGYTAKYDFEDMSVEYEKVPGFVVYAKSASAGAQYAYDNGFKLITEVTARKMKTSLKTKALKKRKVRLTWAKKQYANGYQIYKATKRNGKYKKVAMIKKPDTVKWTSKSAARKYKGKRLYYKIRPYTVVDGKAFYGKWSAVKSVKIR